MRVLHLIDPGAAGGGACTLRLLAEPLQRIHSIRQDVLVIGTRAHAALARRCGVDPVGTISPPRNFSPLAWSSLKRYLSEVARYGREYDVVHAWTARTALLSMLACPDLARLATLAVGPVSGVVMQWLARLLDEHPMPLLATSRSVKQEYEAMGVDRQWLSIMLPAVNPDSVESHERDELRRRWGVGDETLVAGLLSEPIAWADARAAVEVVTLAAKCGRDVRLVAHPAADRRMEAQRWAEHIGLPDLMILEDELAEPWRVLDGLDAGLLLSGARNSISLANVGSPYSWLIGGGRRVRPMPGVMPLLWAMSAGVPVIAESGDAVKSIIEDGRTGLLVNQHDAPAAGHRLMRLCDDQTIAGRVGASARQVIHDRYHVSPYCVKLKSIYEQVVDPQVNIAHIAQLDAVIRRYEQATETWTVH